jgi:hypothetical protein
LALASSWRILVLYAEVKNQNTWSVSKRSVCTGAMQQTIPIAGRQHGELDSCDEVGKFACVHVHDPALISGSSLIV